MTDQNKHPRDQQLALYSGGDLEFLERIRVGLHLRGCAACRNGVQSHASLREALPKLSSDPAFLQGQIANWDRLSDEMTANIRLGLSAAECIGPSKEERRAARRAAQWLPDFLSGGALSGSSWFGTSWKPALAGFGLCALSVGAFWFNTPPEQKHTLARAWDAMTHGGVPLGERGVVLEATQAGLEMKQDGRSLITVRHPERKPASVSASLGGSIRAGYVDDETGQVTYTNVYSGQ
jgi:hypothetical protein